MIFQFYEYLKAELPTLASRLYVETRDPGDKQESIVIRESSGASDGYNLQRIDAAVQVVCRAKSAFTAREWCQTIFEFCRERHNFDLPAALTGDQLLRVKRVKALQPPYNAGQEPSGMFVYVNNYLLTFQDD